MPHGFGFQAGLSLVPEAHFIKRVTDKRFFMRSAAVPLDNVNLIQKTYEEDFTHGPGGWFGFKGNFEGEMPLEYEGGAVASYGPWWIDYNHAPPHGGGYLSLLFGLMTRGPLGEPMREYGGVNRFIEGKMPTDFTGAELTVRLRGELVLQGAQLALLVQGAKQGICSGWVLTGQPLEITQDWADYKLQLEPDLSQWTSLATRLDRQETYGELPLADVLADVNVNFYFVLFPLDVRPKGPIEGDPGVLRAGRDYRVWQSYLPDGYVVMDSVQIRFADRTQGQP